jgi:hypothetical protein
MDNLRLVDLLARETNLELPSLYVLVRKISKIMEEHPTDEVEKILKHRFNINELLIKKIIDLK